MFDRKLLFGLILMFVAISAGCTSYSLPSTVPKPLVGPQDDTARIYFIFPQNEFVGAETFIFHEDRAIGYLHNRQYFYYDVPAGEHCFVTGWIMRNDKNGLLGNFDGGKTYYIKIFATPSPNIYAGNNIHWDPVEFGTETWNAIPEWLEISEFVSFNQDKFEKVREAQTKNALQDVKAFRSGEYTPIRVGTEHTDSSQPAASK